MSDTRFGAFIITFNRPCILRNTINAILQQTRPPDYILVVDNGDDAQVEQIVMQTYSATEVGYHSLGGNYGPAGATAFGLEHLARRGFEWIYWVDDDDPPQTPDTLERLLELGADSHKAKIGGVGVVGSRFDWRIGEMRRIEDDELAGVLDVDIIAGNQQLILNREMIESVGVADERLFFGLYEPEYCLRIRRAGYRLLVDGETMREHRRRWNRLDTATKRSWVPTYTPRNMWQRYYRTRNYIFMMRKTFSRPDLARREVAKAIGRSVTAWRKGARFGAAFAKLQLRGVVDGYRGHLGRTIEPLPKYDP